MKLSKDAQILSLQAELGESASEINALREEVKAANKALTNEENKYKSASIQRDALQSEINQINALLDILPGPSPRKTQHENGYSDVPVTAMTRLAAWLTVNVK